MSRQDHSTKPKTRDSALPRKRSAPALALQSARHRQRVIPDKRHAAAARAADAETRDSSGRWTTPKGFKPW